MAALKAAVQSQAPEQAVAAYTSQLFYAPNVSWIAMRTGMDKDHDLMASLNGSLGNHQHPPRCANVQASISGRAQSTILFMNHLNTSIYLCIFITNIPTAISASIIYYNNFQISICLINNRIKTFSYIFFSVIHRNYYIY